MNPANCLAQFLDKGNSTIFFSATLLPIHYYKKLLSNSKEDYAIYAESPFDARKRLLLIGTDVSTKYTSRGEAMYRRYAKYLIQVARSRKGNYIAFFPSYYFMEEVYEVFVSLLESVPCYGGREIEYVMQLSLIHISCTSCRAWHPGCNIPRSCHHRPCAWDILPNC